MKFFSARVQFGTVSVALLCMSGSARSQTWSVDFDGTGSGASFSTDTFAPSSHSGWSDSNGSTQQWIAYEQQRLREQQQRQREM